LGAFGAADGCVMPMSSVPAAILAARSAQQAELARKHNARALQLRRRRMHEHRVHVMAALAAGVLLAGVLASGFYLGVIAMPSRSVVDGKSGPGSFAETKTGQLMIPTDGGWCKTLSFDNSTGAFSNSKLVNCEDFNNAAAGSKGRSGSFNTFSDSFRGR
jgi:hypothetical protein